MKTTILIYGEWIIWFIMVVWGYAVKITNQKWYIEKQERKRKCL